MQWAHNGNSEACARATEWTSISDDKKNWRIQHGSFSYELTNPDGVYIGVFYELENAQKVAELIENG